ncbi:hypothetical protein SO694_0006503 [Aureococcus anophagefferens]|uniref:Uncharacterized protein n=1 Tax=Aureococcus anophagefferens TaxID=44056 RepID=A0ABR1FQS4_AURAN
MARRCSSCPRRWSRTTSTRRRRPCSSSGSAARRARSSASSTRSTRRCPSPRPCPSRRPCLRLRRALPVERQVRLHLAGPARQVPDALRARDPHGRAHGPRHQGHDVNEAAATPAAPRRGARNGRSAGS